VPIVATARKTSFKSLMSEASEPLKLAADTETAAETVVLVTEHNQPIARLFHDYLGATLNLAFVRTVPFIEFDAEIHFKDGTHTAAKHLKIKDQEVILLKKTTLTEEDIEHVVLSPQELLTTSK